jgi:predicted amidohydrolase
VDVELVVANWPAARRHHWRRLIDARAIENQTYVVAVNRVGSGGGLDYAGDSRVGDPLGEVLVAGAGAETILLAELRAEVVAEARHTLPFRDDRRVLER